MTTNHQTSIASLAKKRRTYSAEFKQQIVQACKAPDVSIALSCSAPLDPTPTDMLTVQITLPHSKAEIGLKWQVSKISALAELLKALAT